MVIELDLDGKPVEIATGLVWHPLQGDGSARTREILAYAEAAGADLKVLRGEEAPHVGLAQSAEGARPGQVSAAAVIADALLAQGHRSVLVAMPLPQQADTYFYLAVRDSVILADGDTTGSHDQIHTRLTGDRAYGGWDAVICPQQWGLADAQQRSFESFFTSDARENRKRWQLHEVRVDTRRLALIAGIALAGALAAAYGWKTWQKREALAAAIAEARRVQQAEQEATRTRGAAVKAPAQPWPALPAPAVFARACAQALQRVGVTAGNWKLDGAACESGMLHVRWVKASDAAWVSHLKAIRPDAQVAPDGLSATVSAPIGAPASGDTGEALQDAASVRLRYFDLASRYGMAIRVEPVASPAPAPVLPGQAAAPAPPPPPWAETTVQATAGFDPVEAARLLAGPGLRFNKLVFSFSREGLPQYQFTGVQYVRPL